MQQAPLHVHVLVHSQPIHVIVVHLGLIPASRARQVQQLATYIARDVPPGVPLVVAGDFNDWGNQMRHALNRIHMYAFDKPGVRTYPSRLPLAQLDYVYARGMKPMGLEVPRGRIWWRMSDHLPLLAEFEI
jgi:endonuclease/exonuclease/phosphatase family metal-dependent hydrolase